MDGLPSSSADAVRAAAVRQQLLLVAASLLVCALAFTWTVGTAPILGDEAQHFRRAVTYFQEPWPDFRTTHDPAYPLAGECAVRYWDASLWHMGLAIVWKAMGHASFTAAQVYHLVYLALLAIFTYLAARELYGNAGGGWAWGLAVSMPVNLLFGTVFYLEVPAAAMSAMAVYFILRRRPLWLGIALAGMFYLKMPSAAVLAPPLVLAALLRMGDTWRRRAARTALAAAVAFALFLPDMLWRMEHFGRPVIFTESLSLSYQTYAIARLPAMTRGAIPLSVIEPAVAVQTFGLPGLAAFAAALVAAAWGLGHSVRRLGARVRESGVREALRSLADLVPAETAVAGLPLLGYVVAYVVFLPANYDVRYLYPALVFVALLGGGLLARVRPFARRGAGGWLVRAAAGLLVLAMIVQAAAVPAVVRQRRVLPPTVAAGFEWIQGHVPADARILYLEYNLVSMTGRPIIWGALVPRYFFTATEPAQVQILRYFDIRYIAVPPARFVEKVEPAVEPRGYPIGWVRALASRPYLSRVYPDHDCDVGSGEFVLYRVDLQKAPQEWLASPPYEPCAGVPEPPPPRPPGQGARALTP